jgi:hypothetical protein
MGVCIDWKMAVLAALVGFWLLNIGVAGSIIERQ